MSDVDEMLLKLRNSPVPAALANIDAAVLEALDARSQSAAGLALGSTALAAVAALAIGVAGGIPDDRSESSFALGEVSPLAPSSLLAGS